MSTNNQPTIWFITVMIVTLVTGYSFAHPVENQSIEVKAQELVKPTATPQAVPTDIEGYIKYKFGEYAPKAFLLLQGNSPGSCAENRYLNPRAVNDNTTWGGVGIDRGIFQINSVYHPLTEAQAFDWKTNIDYAYRMFVNDHNTFSRWTCGKVYGI